MVVVVVVAVVAVGGEDGVAGWLRFRWLVESETTRQKDRLTFARLSSSGAISPALANFFLTNDDSMAHIPA